jgi:hypothetical protein
MRDSSGYAAETNHALVCQFFSFKAGRLAAGPLGRKSVTRFSIGAFFSAGVARQAPPSRKWPGTEFWSPGGIHINRWNPAKCEGSMRKLAHRAFIVVGLTSGFSSDRDCKTAPHFRRRSCARPPQAHRRTAPRYTFWCPDKWSPDAGSRTPTQLHQCQ